MQVSGLSYAYMQPATAFRPGAAPVSDEPSRSRTREPVDRIEVSDAARQSAASLQAGTSIITGTSAAAAPDSCAECEAGICTTCGKKDDKDELSEEEQAQVSELKERDTEVRAHEAAHAATGGSFAGSPSFEFQVGPDGKRYAIGGEVQIDTSPIDGNPSATIDKLRQVQAAALAPAEPSGQDKKVAQQAAAAQRDAEAALATERRAEFEDKTKASGTEATRDVDIATVEQNEKTAVALSGGNPLTDSDTPMGQGQQSDLLALQEMQQAASVYQKIAGLV